MKLLDDDFIGANMAMVGEDRAAYYGKRTVSASAIGHECDAFVALSFRSFPEAMPSDEAARRMKLGRKIEEIVLDDMLETGLPVVKIDATTGRQWMFTGYEGHAKCYADGLLLWDGIREPIEIKSMNTKRFAAVVSKGLKDAEPKYYDQIQTVMGLGGFVSGLFVAYNRDNSKYYVKRILFDLERWGVISLKIERALSGEGRRISKDGSDWRCKMCGRFGACQKGEAPPVTKRECHHCIYSSPDVSGQWWCDKFGEMAKGPCWAFDLFNPRD